MCIRDSQALAGPAAGPNGGQIYIDGFTGGQIPPKSSIREIRVNQNPFSAEFDRIGYGRIEILTKPGSDKFSGHILSLIHICIQMPFVLEHPRIHVAGQLPEALRDNAHNQGALAGYPNDTSQNARVAAPKTAPRRLAQNESCCVLAI